MCQFLLKNIEPKGWGNDSKIGSFSGLFSKYRVLKFNTYFLQGTMGKI